MVECYLAMVVVVGNLEPAKTSHIVCEERKRQMQWGKLKENIIRFNHPVPDFKIMFLGHDSLYVRIWKFEMRIMKPWKK